MNHINLPYLEVLDMIFIQIVDSKPKSELNCIELKELCIQYKQIKDIGALNDSLFPKLRLLRIENNLFHKSEQYIIKKYKNK